MKKQKTIIIGIICLLIVLVILLVAIIIARKNQNTIEYYDYDYPEETFYVESVKDASKFYTIKGIVTQYEEMIIYEQSESLYYNLSSNYIEDNSITVDNVLSKVSNVSFDNEIDEFTEIDTVINKMYVMETDDGINDYFVSGYIVVSKDYSNKIDIALMIETDDINYTFQIYPYEYMEKKGYVDIKEGDQITIETEEITANDYNTFTYQTVTDETIIGDYFRLYKYNAIYGDASYSYEFLDKEYREKKFGSLEAYKEYISNNIVELIKSTISKYDVKTDGDDVRYICIDQNGKYYIFTASSIMDFDVILDTYTIDLPEFTEKYNSATDQQKVALNIDKFMQAINAKDYKYAYNCLANSYKNNYFKTQAEFETYAKENFYGSSTVGYSEFGVQGDYYTYSVVLTDEETGEQKNKTFIIQLGEGTEFVLSFDK